MKTYQSYSGNLYMLGEMIGAGGEGKVFDITNGPCMVAKLYNESERNEHREHKLLCMMQTCPDPHVINQFAWPIDILYEKGKFAGFVMPKIHGVPLNTVYSEEYKTLPLSKKITIAKNLCAALHNLHEAGHIAGDLNPYNILVTPETGFVHLLDCDSFHISDSKKRIFRCQVAMPEYLAPSVSQAIQGESLKSAVLPTFSEDSDSFSLGIHIFQLLMNGAHPYALAASQDKRSVILPQPAENIKSGNFPYKKCPQGFRLPIYAFPFDVLPEKLKQIFIRRFSNNENIPIREWYDALCDYEKRLKPCRNDPSHEFRKGLKRCPNCAVIKNTTRYLSSGKIKKAPVDTTSAASFFSKKATLSLFSVILAALLLLFSGLCSSSNSAFEEILLGTSGGCICGLVLAVLHIGGIKDNKVTLKNYVITCLCLCLGFALYSIVYVLIS